METAIFAPSIQIIVPYQPGGPTDITSRILSKRLSDLLGQQVIVVNKAGGGTAIGVQSVLTAAADGYTIAICGAKYYYASSC
jgi:tripartite-type tricarboxylate transporter receptor subunit TctC